MQKKPTDNQLVELAKANPDEFTGLVNRYWQPLFVYIKRISYFSHEDIEDILQDSFIKAYKNLNSFDNDLKFSSWIYRITRNTTFDAIRKKQTRPLIANLDINDAVNLFQSSVNMEKDVIEKDEIEKVKKIINSLDRKYKEVLVLKFLEDKSYEEIMDILKKPRGTVAALINRGKKKMTEAAKGLF